MKILFICTANVCRSPLAEGYLRSLLTSRRDSRIHVSSAGVMALSGSPAFECSVVVGQSFGFDLSRHKSRQFTAEIGQEMENILCMETWQAARIISMYPTLAGKVQLLGAYHPSSQRLLQIYDPRDFTVAETIKTFELIRASVDSIVKQLVNP